MSDVRLSPEAVDELAEAAAWYAAQRPGLESEFLAEAERIPARDRELSELIPSSP